MGRENVVMTAEDEAAEEVAFEAGFGGTDVEPAPAVETPTEPAEPAEEPAATEEPDPASAEPAKNLSYDEILAKIEEQKQEMQKTRDKLFGKVGELQQKIDTVRTQASGLSPQAKTRVGKDFPELFAMLFDEDDTPAAPLPDLPTATTGIDEVTQKFERKLLARDHKDWEQVVASDEFNDWAVTELSPEDAATLKDTWDSDYVSGKLTEFKDWKAAKATQAEVEREKQERLDSAITPQGRPRDSTSPTRSADEEEAAMLASYGRKNN